MRLATLLAGVGGTLGVSPSSKIIIESGDLDDSDTGRQIIGRLKTYPEMPCPIDASRGVAIDAKLHR